MADEYYWDGQGRRQKRETKSGSEIDTNAAVAKQSTTAGADLGGAAERARKARESQHEETDPSKMSPLARLAYENKKKRTGKEAGDALAGGSK